MSDIRPLVPHAGSMCLLEDVVSHSSEEIHCITRSHLDAANPLRRQGRLAALHLAEYAAQAMAAHGALQAQGRAQPGMLAALRDIRLHVDRIDDLAGTLDIRARRRLAQPEGSLYEFRVSQGERLLAEGRIAIALSTA